MTGYLGKRTNQDRDVVGRQIQNKQENQWGPIPGEIVSYDAAAGTATVKPLYKPVHNGNAVDMPELYEVPVDLPRTGSAGMTFPIPAGTKVMLTPAMRSMDNYEAGEGGEPFDGRSFHLADMRASIAGGDSLSDPMPNVDADNTHLRFSPDGAFGIKGSPDGKFRIDGSEGNLYDIIATFMELVASDQLIIAYGSSAGTGHQLQNRAELMELAAKVRAMAL
ncbi:Gp138 family membrane-puncturing spike protein [Gellertiella hungarica]|uniref:Phage protein Gp138 N-terminal domain-containing protein n=1 Tax=Gellertiella hungarica TaxID=1572859 RepID=A0A7W6J2S6_9HYPH|nr:Gp138 family membrane-puncturing spike protein [Gellertiella hungarica]MBB4063694.1 hypothetical protein [Gellertiella hungarica]